jgi:hypothetical protein
MLQWELKDNDDEDDDDDDDEDSAEHFPERPFLRVTFE